MRLLLHDDRISADRCRVGKSCDAGSRVSIPRTRRDERRSVPSAVVPAVPAPRDFAFLPPPPASARQRVVSPAVHDIRARPARPRIRTPQCRPRVRPSRVRENRSAKPIPSAAARRTPPARIASLITTTTSFYFICHLYLYSREILLRASTYRPRDFSRSANRTTTPASAEPATVPASERASIRDRAQVCRRREYLSS